MIGSITKTVTARLLAEAAVVGILGLVEPLEGPNFRGVRVTPGHLATHLSGLPRLPHGMNVLSKQPYAAWDLQRLDRAFRSARLGAYPGTEYRYSNFGVAVLGQELARRHGVSYEELALDLLKRMGCASAGFDLPPPGLFHDGKPVKPWEMAAFFPAGGLTMTVGDLVAYGQAVYTDGSEAGRLVREWRPVLADGPLSIGTFLRRRLRRGSSRTVGLAWHFLPNGSLFHDGMVAGYSSLLLIQPDGRGRAVLSASMRSKLAKVTLT